MTNTIRRATLAILFFAAVTGWSLAANAYIGLVPQAAAPDGSSVEQVVRNYISAQVRAEAGSQPYEQVKLFVTGQALTTVNAIEAAKADPQSGLTITGVITTKTLWRDNANAMVEATYTISLDAQSTLVGQHFMLTYSGGTWKISALWRLAIDPGGPLLPPASATPGQVSPSFNPSPSISIVSSTPPATASPSAVPSTKASSSTKP